MNRSCSSVKVFDAVALRLVGDVFGDAQDIGLRNKEMRPIHVSNRTCLEIRFCSLTNVKKRL